MKHLLLSAALLLAALPGRAQSGNPAVWCPPGAVWTYGWDWWDETGTLTVRYDRDTVIAGQPAQVLSRLIMAHDRKYPTMPDYPVPMPKLVTRTTGDQVQVQGNGGTFYTLYDFGAAPGSSWLTPRVHPYGPCPSEMVRVVVDSVGTQRLAGQPRRWFRAHLTSPTGAAVLGSLPYRIYEQVGDLIYMQPQSPTCAGTDPGHMGSLRTYQATGQPALRFTAGGQLLATATARATAAGFAAYPNPGAGRLTLELPATVAPAATLRLLDLTGRTVRRLPLPTSRQLDVSGLPAGTYTLLLEGTGQPTLAHRLVVE